MLYCQGLFPDAGKPGPHSVVRNTAAQIIAAASRSPANVAPTRATSLSSRDSGPDVADLVAEAELDDAASASRYQETPDSDLFGKVLFLILLAFSVLILAFRIAAFGSLEVRSNPSP
jgi:hypothetical protein